MADLVEIGFKIKLDGLEQANTLVGGLLTKVESLEKGMKDVPAATAKAASGLKATGKAAKETGDSLSAAEKKLKKTQDTAEYMAQGLTRSMASAMASMKQMKGGEVILKDFKIALDQIYKLSGNKNPFDSVAGALTRVNTGLKEAIETQKALQSGMRITSQQAKDLVDIQARGDALKLDASAIDAQKQAYMQESALLNTITAQNKTITDEQDRQLKKSKEQLRIQQNFNAEIEKTKRVNALKSEGFSTSQANKIIGFEDSGVSKSQIDEWKKLNLVTKEAKVAVDNYGDAAVAAFRKSQAAIDSQIEKTKLSIAAVKEGFSKTSATSIANFSMQSGVTPAQIAEFKKLRMEMDKLDVASRRTTGGFTKMSEVARQLIPSIGAIGLAGVVAASIREVVRLADAANLVVARINLVKGAAEDTTAIFNDLVDISKANRVELTTTATLYTRLMPALEGIGKGTKEAMRVTEAFGASLLVSGANTQEMIAATTQFSQAMASGRLAGDEFRSISEASPAFLKAIAEGAGVARSELKAMSQDQLLTTEFITNALDKQFEKLRAQAAGLPLTVGQAWQNMKTDVTLFAKELNESTGFIEGLTGVITDFGSAVKTLAPLFTTVGSAIGFVVSIMDDLTVILVAYEATALAVKVANSGVAVSLGLITVASKAATLATTALTAAMNLNPLVAVGTAIAYAAYKIYDYVSGIKATHKEQVKANKSLREFSEQSAKSLTLETASLGKIINKYSDLSAAKETLAQQSLTADQEKEYASVAKAQEHSLKVLEEGGASQEEYTRKLERNNKALADFKNAMLAANLAQKILNQADSSGATLVQDLKDQAKELDSLLALKKHGLELDQTKMLLEYTNKVTAANNNGATIKDQSNINILVAKYIELLKTVKGKAAEVSTAFSGMSGGGDKKNTFDEEIKSLNALLSAYSKYGDMEIAQMVSRGATIKQTEKILALREREKAITDSIAKSEKLKADTKSSNEDLSKLQAVVALQQTGLSQKEAELAIDLQRGLISQQMYDNAVATAAIQVERDFNQELETLSIMNEYLLAGYDAETARTLAAGKYNKEQIDQLTNAKELQELLLEMAQTAEENQINPFKDLIETDFDSLFGDIGKSINSLASAFGDLSKAAAKYKDSIATLEKSSQDAFNKGDISGFLDQYEKQAKAEIQLTKDKKKAEQDAYADMANSAKGFFKEKSAGYKALDAVEKTIRAAQIAHSLWEKKDEAIKLALKLKGYAADLGAFLVNLPIKIAGLLSIGAAASSAAIAAASIQPGPLAFVGFAAMAALMASIGFSGGSSSSSMPSSNEGKGTVFGDKDAESKSIKNAIELLAENSRVELPITSAMLQSLRNIESNIGGLTNLLIRSGGAGERAAAGVQTGFEMDSVGVGMVAATRTALAIFTLGISEFLGIGKAIGNLIGGLFGSKTKITGQGLYASGQNLSEIMGDGFNLKEYVDIQVKKKSFGITTSKKSSTKYSDASDELSNQFGLIFAGFYDTVKLAAIPLGKNLDDVTSKLDAFVVNIGKVNLKGLDGEEIQEKLEAIFGQQADLIAQAALYGLEDFQQVGEGYFETITRVATSVERAKYSADRFRVSIINYSDIINKQGDVAVELLRQSLMVFEQSAYGFNTGVSEIISNFDGSIDELDDMYSALLDMRRQLVAAGHAAQNLSTAMILGAGSFEALGEGLSSYFDDFLSAEEQAQSMTKTLTAEFARLNQALPEGKDGFKDLVNSIDTSTAAGQELFGAVIALAPAFADLQDIMEEIGGVGTPNLLAQFLSLESQFDALGVKMPNTTAEFDELVTKLILSAGSVVDLSTEFDILTQANQRLSASNVDVSSKTESLNEKFAALGLQLPENRVEFDNLILTLRDASGSSTDMSLAVESLSDEFNLLSIATQQQEAAALAAGYAYDNLQNATGSSTAGTNGLANQVRALSSDFYDFQIQLAEFGGEAGEAIASLFDSLYSARSNVESNIASISGTDSVVMNINQIKSALSSIGDTILPSDSDFTKAVNKKLLAEQAIGSLSDAADSKLASANAAKAPYEAQLASAIDARDAAKSVYDGLVARIFGNEGKPLFANSGTHFSSKFSETEDGKMQFDRSYNVSYGSAEQKALADKILVGPSNKAGYDYANKENALRALEAQADSKLAPYNALMVQYNALLQERQVKETELAAINSDVLEQQDALRTSLQEYALDAEKNIGRLEKLRTETMKYYEAQKALSDLMTTTASKLSATLKSVRDSQLTPLQLLDQMQAEFNSAYAKAQVATGDALASAASELDALISPLLAQAEAVYASGSGATEIRDFVLSAGDEIVARLNELNPVDYEAESLSLLNAIDSSLYTLEEAAVQANMMLIAAIDLSRVQTVAELENLVKLAGGTPVDKSQFVTSANGNAFSGGNVMAFANGGAFTNSVVNSPTLFPLGLMGEAGAEAIMPLARSGDGSLGVRIVGGMPQQDNSNTETNMHLGALVRVQQEGNQKIIAKLSKMEERLDGLESAARLEAAS